MDWITREDSGDQFESCVFCELCEFDDDRGHRILARSDHAYVVVNKSPYTPGHLIVVPNAHVADIAEMDEEDMVAVFRLLQKATEAVNVALHPEGMNVGMNIGKAGGASIEDHLHIHVVPRWQGDTTFMPTTANTKIIAEALDETYDRLLEALCELEGTEVSSENQSVVVT